MDRLVKIIRITIIIFFIIWGLVWFSIRASEQVNKGNDSLINSILVDLYNAPYLVRQWYFENVNKSYQAISLDGDLEVREIGMMRDIQKLPDSIFLLHSKYINDDQAQVLLQNIKTGEIQMKWNISLGMIRKDLDSIRTELNKKSSMGMATKNIDFYVPAMNNAIIIRTPIFQKDSSLIFHINYLSQIYKIDKNSNLLWKSKRLTHHSLEIDSNNHLWTCSTDFDYLPSVDYKYRDDAILSLNNDGEELYFESLTTIFKNNNLFKKIIESSPIRETKSGLDPFHLNDVQPTVFEGPNWNQNDLFLSVRDKSLIVQYRPATGKIIWYEQGPWNKQHDITIESDSIISVFNNNMSFFNMKVNSTSNIAKYNFSRDESSFLGDELFTSETEGRQLKIFNGYYIVEETNKGKYFVLDEKGMLIAKFYVPFQEDKANAQYPGWSRLYLKKNNYFIEQ